MERKSVPNLQLDQRDIKRINQVELLDLTFDLKLTWKPDILKVKEECRKRLNNLKILFYRNWRANINVLKLTYKAIISKRAQTQLNIPTNLKSIDPNFSEPIPIDAIIGGEYFWQLLTAEQRKIPWQCAVLQKTVFVSIIAGEHTLSKLPESTSSHLLIMSLKS